MAFDIRKRNWSGRMLDAAGIDIELMPELSESAAIIGELTRSAAGKMGLFPGLPVITGAGDTGAMMLGAGAIDDGDAVLYLGGGAEVDLVTGRELLNTKMPIPVRCHVLPGRYFTSVTALASGVARNWLSDIFNYSPHNASLSFSRAARRAGVGAHGFLFLPYLLGEQGSIWDPYARGAFIGLTGSTTSSDFCRAVLESTAYSLHQILTLYKKTGLRPRRFVICGGGARNRLLSEIVTDALGVQTRLHDNAEEVAAIGTAICAAASLRRYKSLHAAANQMVHCHKRLTPKSANYEKYIRMLRLSEQAYLALRNIFHELSKFQKRDHDL
jgi:xylulokinase